MTRFNGLEADSDSPSLSAQLLSVVDNRSGDEAAAVRRRMLLLK